LEQLSEGRLRHVEFAGPASFVDVPVRSGSSTTRMERIVRESTSLDSDGDGILNAYDAYPLDFDGALTLTGRRASNETSIHLTWQAQPQVTYQIEHSSSLTSPNWQPLSTFTNSSSTPQTADIQDRLSGDHTERYYRLRASQ
jgi:hypothetical protein